MARDNLPTPQGMSSEDEVRPYHAASGSQTADTLAEVLEHAAAREEAAHKRMAQKKQAKWVLPLGVNLGVFAVYLLIAPPAWVVMDPISAPPTAEQEEMLRNGMWTVATRIENYRLENGRLPPGLSDVNVQPGGLEYRIQGRGLYELIGSIGETPMVYSSTQDLGEWVGIGLASRMGG